MLVRCAVVGLCQVVLMGALISGGPSEPMQVAVVRNTKKMQPVASGVITRQLSETKLPTSIATFDIFHCSENQFTVRVFNLTLETLNVSDGDFEKIGYTAVATYDGSLIAQKPQHEMECAPLPAITPPIQPLGVIEFRMFSESISTTGAARAWRSDFSIQLSNHEDPTCNCNAVLHAWSLPIGGGPMPK